VVRGKGGLCPNTRRRRKRYWSTEDVMVGTESEGTKISVGHSSNTVSEGAGDDRIRGRKEEVRKRKKVVEVLSNGRRPSLAGGPSEVKKGTRRHFKLPSEKGCQKPLCPGRRTKKWTAVKKKGSEAWTGIRADKDLTEEKGGEGAWGECSLLRKTKR